MKWVAPAELAGYAFPEANRPIIAAIEKCFLIPEGIQRPAVSDCALRSAFAT